MNANTWGMRLENLAFGLLMGLALLFPFEFVKAPWRPFPWVAITNVEVLVAVVLVVWGSAALARRQVAFPRPLGWCVGLWLLVVAGSALAAPAQREAALKFTVRTAQAVALGWAAYDLAHTPSRRRWLVGALGVAGALVALLGLAEAAGWSVVQAWLLNFKHAPTRIGEVVRVSASLVYATVASMVLELTASAVLGLALDTRRTWRWGWLGLFLLLLTVQLLTLTRAGTLAILAALAWCWWWGWRWRWAAARLAALGGMAWLVGLFLLLVWVNPILGLRLKGESDRVWYQAQYEAPSEVVATAGALVRLPVRVWNKGVRSWHPSGAYAFALSYHMQREDGTMVTYDGLRSPLPRVVLPGEQVVVQAQVLAPSEAGRYRVEWDMVQEAVTWFSWKGAPTATTWLLVEGSAPAGDTAPVPTLPASAPPTDVRLVVPAPGRLTLWRVAWRMVQAHPWLGVGPDNFRLVYGAYAGVEWWDVGIHANNLYIEWLADTGVVGVVVFLSMVAAIGWHVWRGLMTTAARERGVLLAGSAALVAWHVHGGFDAFHEFWPTLIPFWLLVGITVRLADDVCAQVGQDAHRI
nr:O-antigen ligase family protein [Ardenticatena sp.]